MPFGCSENDLEDQDDIYENVYEDENEAVYGNLCYRPDQSPQPQVFVTTSIWADQSYTYVVFVIG